STAPERELLAKIKRFSGSPGLDVQHSHDQGLAPLATIHCPFGAKRLIIAVGFGELVYRRVQSSLVS
ncbi:MAG: hypothetical protein AABZ08_09975, partial [Planctomycetota bacterium]